MTDVNWMILYRAMYLKTPKEVTKAARPSLIKQEKKKENILPEVFYMLLFSCNFDDQLSQKFHRFVVLWQLPKMSSAFKQMNPMLTLLTQNVVP